VAAIATEPVSIEAAIIWSSRKHFRLSKRQCLPMPSFAVYSFCSKLSGFSTLLPPEVLSFSLLLAA